MEKILLIFSVFCLLLFNTASAEEYLVKDYKRLLVVSETNSISVREFINVKFFNQSSGMHRDIPIVNYITRPDGSVFINHGRISNITASENSKTENRGINKRITVGTPEMPVKGDHTYVFVYDYQMQQTNLKDKDEFYFNIVGPNWTTQINNVFFEVQMPKGFQKDKVKFAIGKTGIVGSKKDIKYQIIGNTIKGQTLRPLKAHEAVTISIELPKGYFLDGAKEEKYITKIIAGVLVLIALILWIIFGRKKEIAPVVSYQPNKKLTSAQTGAFYSEGASAKDITSMLFYLANKGYIQITNNEDDFIFKRLKNNEGASKLEAMFLNSIFKNKDVASRNELVSSSIFYEDCNELIEKLDESLIPLYKKSSLSFGIKIIPAISVIGLMYLLYYIMLDYSFESLLSTFVYPLISSLFILIPIGIYMQLKNNFSSIVIMVNIALYFTVMIFFSSLFLPRDYMNGLISSKIEAVTITIALVISTACLYLMPNKTALGLKYLNETLGFKKFLEGADENKIHILAKKLPKYCYNVLSYAVALDIGTMWVKKIEKVILKQPAWFIGPFNAEAIDNLTKSFIEAMDKYIKK